VWHIPLMQRLAHRPAASALALLVTWQLACDPPRRQEPAPAAAGARAEARSAPGAQGASAAPIRYRVSFDEAPAHYLDVTMEVPTGGAAEIDLMMAVWTPGSYLVREFSRHVEGLTATGPAGEALAVRKSRKNRWRVSTGGADPLRVHYKLYAAELTVRTSWVSDDLAILNGAPTFITVAGALDRPHEVSLVLPDHWRDVVTALPPHPDGALHRFLAPDYDTLVDSPIVIGAATVERFAVDGVPHRLAFLGDTGAWDAPRAASDVRRLVEAQRDLWRGLPYRSYLFIVVLMDGARGGLEHLDSTLILSSPWAMRRRSDYLSWLGLVSHELFHAWNVKRLRPAELGPFDYENEVYTESLWVAEGLTSYYDDLLLVRAGLMKQDEYLALLSDQIRGSETRPGRLVQPLAQSSFDAWIKYYRPDENSANSSVNYYGKGAVVGFLLDAAIRGATEGRRSLDDVMRLAYQRYAGERGYTPEEIRGVLAEIAGRPLDALWRAAVEEAGPLDLEPALDHFGLRFKAAPGGGDEPAGYLGVETRDHGGRLRVSRVVRGGPGFSAGLQADDEIIAIDDRRVSAGGLEARLVRHRPGERVEILLSRWERLRRIPVVLGAAPQARHDLEPAPQASAAQRARLAAWLRR
jgi:predicted metalloprotease with PDZ domain